MPRTLARRALVTVATLGALVAAPSSAHAVAPGSASARRALAATLAGDTHGGAHGDRAREGRRRCPDPMPASAGGRLAGRVEGTLARWSATARRWATERAALAVYVVEVTSDLAVRLTDQSA